MNLLLAASTCIASNWLKNSIFLLWTMARKIAVSIHHSHQVCESERVEMEWKINQSTDHTHRLHAAHCAHHQPLIVLISIHSNGDPNSIATAVHRNTFKRDLLNAWKFYHCQSFEIQGTYYTYQLKMYDFCSLFFSVAECLHCLTKIGSIC